MINNDDNDNPTIISNSKTCIRVARLISSDSVNPDRLTRTKKSNVKFKKHQYKQSASFGGDQQSEPHCNPSTKSKQTSAQMAMTFMLTSL